jgi:ATP-dependent DNA ligase
MFTDFELAKKEMIKGEWEGLVIWDLDMCGGFTVNGKPKRLKGAFKWKNVKEDDFFVYDIEPEKGDSTRVGALKIAQYDEVGNLIACGNVGSGLTKEEKLKAWDWKGAVWEIQFDHRMAPNDKGERCLQFPRLVRMRTDKKPEECVFNTK